jgi:hypothetical protein
MDGNRPLPTPMYRKTFVPSDLRSRANGGNQPHEDIV